MTPLEARRAVGHDDIVFALRSSIEWHDEQGRPHSAGVDRDALAELERLRGTLRAVRGSSDPAWQVRLINEALGEGETP